MDGWADKMPNTYESAFQYHADQFELNQAADRLEVLKTDYLGQ
jgi:hypothetical protein